MEQDRLKILVIVDSFPPHHLGGYELRCKDIVEGMRRRGHEIMVLTTLCPPSCHRAHDDAHRVWRCLHKKSQSKSRYMRIVREIQDLSVISKMVRMFNPHLVALYHLGDLANGIVPLLSQIDRPVMLDDGGIGAIYVTRLLQQGFFKIQEEDGHLKQLGKKAVHLVVRLVTGHTVMTEAKWPSNLHICFNSEFSREYAGKQGVPIAKGRVIYPGIDISVFSFNNRNEIAAPVHILTPGRISPEKGVLDAVRLIAELHHRGTPARLTIVGPVYDPDYQESLSLVIQENRLGQSVAFVPMVPHSALVHYYHAAEFCFFPSYQVYGFSRVPLEAMATGCIVLTYGNEGSREIIEPGRTGIVIPEGDISSAADAIQEFITRVGLFREVACSARRLVEERFSLDRYIGQIEDYWCSIAAWEGHGQRVS